MYVRVGAHNPAILRINGTNIVGNDFYMGRTLSKHSEPKFIREFLQTVIWRRCSLNFPIDIGLTNRLCLSPHDGQNIKTRLCQEAIRVKRRKRCGVAPAWAGKK